MMMMMIIMYQIMEIKSTIDDSAFLWVSKFYDLLLFTVCSQTTGLPKSPVFSNFIKCDIRDACLGVSNKATDAKDIVYSGHVT